MRFFRPYYEGESGGAGAGAGGQAAPLTLDKWRDALPSELQSEASLADIRDVVGLAKGYVHAQRMVGRDKVPVPLADAKPEDWAAVMAKLGRPETADKYDLALSGLPEGFTLDIDDKTFRDWAHKHNLLPWQAKALYQDLAASRAIKWQESSTAQTAALTESGAALKSEWGAAYQQNVALAEKAFRQFAPKELVAAMEQQGGPSKMHPMFLKSFAAAGKLIAEDALHGDQGDSILTPASAKAKIAGIQGDKAHAYHNRKHPGHDAAVQEMARLFEQAYPNERAS